MPAIFRRATECWAYRRIVDVTMKPVSELKPKMGGSKPVDRQSSKQDDAWPASEPTSILSFLEAENVRLRQAVVELSLDTMALREALQLTARDRRLRRSCRGATSAEHASDEGNQR